MSDFSAVEARTARAVLRRLTNRQAVIGAATVSVIFDDGFITQDVGGLPLESTGPRFTALTSDLPTPILGQPVTISANNYKVREHHPDGTGISLCLLHKA